MSKKDPEQVQIKKANYFIKHTASNLLLKSTKTQKI